MTLKYMKTLVSKTKNSDFLYYSGFFAKNLIKCCGIGALILGISFELNLNLPLKTEKVKETPKIEGKYFVAKYRICTNGQYGNWKELLVFSKKNKEDSYLALSVK